MVYDYVLVVIETNADNSILLLSNEGKKICLCWGFVFHAVGTMCEQNLRLKDLLFDFFRAVSEDDRCYHLSFNWKLRIKRLYLPGVYMITL